MILIAFIFIFASCVKSKNTNVNIYNVVKEAFLTDKGYSANLSKYMSEEVFKKTNIYNTYNVNNPDLKKPFRVDFSLREDSQNVKGDLVIVKMIYSVKITDSQGKGVGGSGNIPITFTVKKTGNEWYIVDKYEAP